MLILPFLFGCSRGLDPIAAQAVLDEPNSAKGVPLLPDFEFRLMRSAIDKDSKKNELISPFSVSVCLSMLANGAKGPTREAIAKTLGVDLTRLDEWNGRNLSLMQTLLKDKNVDFAVANSLWTFDDVAPSEEYVDLLRRHYGAEAFSLKNADDEGLSRINEWTKTNTRGRIPQIVDHFTAGSYLVLVNALAFDGEWKQEFDAGKTQPMDFHLADGRTVQVSTMHEQKLKALSQKWDDGATILSMLYEGERFGMVCILPPEEKTAAQYLHMLDERKVEDLIGLFGSDEVMVALPKFKMEKTTDLEPVLTAMGAGVLFTPGNDFSGICPDPMVKEQSYVSQAVQKSFIEWDEEGTRAAAATMVENATGGTSMDRFIADRPFIYLLVNHRTRTILFVGICNDPSV